MFKVLRAAIKRQPRSTFFNANHTTGFGPLKSSLFSLRSWEKSSKYQFSRNYATHRETGGGWRSGSGSRGQGSSFRGPWWWDQFKVPILFTAGVITVDHTVLSPLFDSTPMTLFKRNPEYLVYGIMAINGINFLLWRVPQYSRFMNRYFLLQKMPQRFSAWSMIGSAFSHQEFWHLGVNMFVLYQFGVPVARWLGSGDFMASYMDSCVLSSLGSLMLPSLVRGAGLALPSLGASGAIYSVLGIFCYLAPNARLALLFIPLPVGAWWVFLGGLGYNLFQVARRAQTGFDHAGHLAGALTGVAWGWLASEKLKKKRQQRQEKLRQFEYRVFR